MATKFYQLGRARDPLIFIDGSSYSARRHGETSYPPNPSTGYARICSPGTKWYDVLSTNLFNKGVWVFGERAVEAIKSEGLSGIDFNPITFEESDNKRLLLGSEPQKYYWGLITGTIPVKMSTPDGCVVQPDPETGRVPSGAYVTRYELDHEGWDGSDFVRFSNVDTGHRFASERVTEVAKKHKLTNFPFQELVSGHIKDKEKYSAQLKYL